MTGTSDNDNMTDDDLLADAAKEGEVLPPIGEQPQAEAAAEAEAGPSTKELLNGVLLPGFTVLAPAWEVTPDECEALADAYAPVIDKWFPDMAEQSGPELAALLMTAAVVAPRLGKPRKEPEKATVEGEAQADATA